jgi:ABC-type iron transport system FetAB permease component
MSEIVGLALRLLQKAGQAVPAMKYAMAVAGLSAVVALVLVGLDLDATTAVIGSLLVLAFMVLVVVFAAVAKEKAGLRPLAVFFMWSFSVVAVASMSLLVSCFFFDEPKTIPCLLKQECPPTQPRQAGDTASSSYQ